MHTDVTLDQIKWRHKRISDEIRKVRREISEDYAELFAPPEPSGNSMETIMNVVVRTWSVMDGALLGYKLFRKFSRMLPFASRKKYKR